MRATPDDHAPYLAWARELRAHGDPRGELIEAQCALERSAGEGADAGALHARVAELLAAHGAAWAAEHGLLPHEVGWQRGCIRTVKLTPTRLDAVGARLAREVPVHRLRLREIQGRAELAGALANPLLPTVRALDLGSNELDPACAHVLSEATQLSGVTELGLSNNRLGPDVAAIFVAPHFASLEVLGLAFSQFATDDGALGEDGAWCLAAATQLTRLVELNLQFSQIGEPGLRALTEAPHLAGLRKLWLAGCGIDADGVRMIARTLPQLTDLDLWGNRLGPDGARHLVEGLPHLTSLDLGSTELDIWDVKTLLGSPHLGAMRALYLGDNELDDGAARALASARRLTQLRILHLKGCEIGADGAHALATSPHLATLRQLQLSYNPIGADGARSLAAATHLDRLVSLSLASCGLGVDGVRALAAAPQLATLMALQLDDNGLGPQGAHALAGATQLTGLTELSLSANALGPEGGQALAAATHWSQLEVLDLGHNALGAEGARALAGAAHLGALRELRLAHNALGNEGALALAAAPWLPSLTRLFFAPSDQVTEALGALREVAPNLTIVGAARE